MNKTNFHLLDGMLSPGDAQQAYASLKDWLQSDSKGQLDIAPVTQLPSQVALQLLIAAERELAQSEHGSACMTDDARRFCALSAGPALSLPLLPPHRSA